MPCNESWNIPSAREQLESAGTKRLKTPDELYKSLLRHHQAVEEECEQWRTLFREIFDKIGNIKMQKPEDWHSYTYRYEDGGFPRIGPAGTTPPEDWLRDEDYKK